MAKMTIDSYMYMDYTLNIKLFDFLILHFKRIDCMSSARNKINELLVDVYNDILKTEENAFKEGQFNDVSIKEVHTIEAIGMYEPKTMSEVARILKITVGTLTVAINNLVKKGYVERYKSESDRRLVKIGLTKKGRLLYRMHEKFHITMVNNCTDDFSCEEMEALQKALEKLNLYFKGDFNNR
jgi:DNA-binding MarR family transcriptional regulator